MAFDRAVSRRASATAIALIVSFSAVAVSGCAGGLLKRAPRAAENPVAIGVNSYLWRASLDTLSFLPPVSADPYGGVIVYDWYINPQTPNERFKTTVYILDSRLRADALNVSISKEVKDAAGAWTGAAVNPQTEIDLENAILTRARQLNLSTRR